MGIARRSSDINMVAIAATAHSQIELINVGLGPDNDAAEIADVDELYLGILIFAEAISRPKSIIVAALDIHPYLVVDNDQVVFRRQWLRPI